MFYVNNEQVLGIFLNGNNYNYLAYGFGKIIPEDRNSVQLNLNLAYKYLNQYRIEYGTVKDGYENALVSPRIDKPDSNGVFHSPFTYYHNGNIVPTKEVDILITNGFDAFAYGNVYNDININGNYSRLAHNVDFHGKTIRTNSENESYESYLSDNVFKDCNNFTAELKSKYSTGRYAVLFNCNNFNGNYKFEGNNDVHLPGFSGFLRECRDGKFNIDTTNLRGGGSDTNIYGRLDFECMQYCNNVDLNITGSSWQSWPQMHAFSYNCNINTFNIIPGFGGLVNSNINATLPKDSTPEIVNTYELLRDSDNCNYKLIGTDCNLSNFYSGVGGSYMFENLNDCNLNLLLNNSVAMDKAFGTRLNNCNIVFDNIKAGMTTYTGWTYLYNCNITGNFSYANTLAAFVYSSRNVNLDINARYTSNMILVQNVDNVTGNANLSNDTSIMSCSNSILNLYYGKYILFNGVDNCNFKLDNINNVEVYGAYNTNFNLYNCDGYSKLHRLSNVTFIERPYKTIITNLDNCGNSHIYANTVRGLIENVNNTYVSLKEVSEYNTVNVYNCDMTGFPGSASVNTENCTFRASLEWAQTQFRDYFEWANVWPHATPRGDGIYSTNAGLESTANLSRCYLNNNNASQVTDSSAYFSNRNMITNLLMYFSRTVTANLPNYATNIKLNVDCHNLNLGVFMAGPPHGLEYSSISADNIFCNTGTDYYVYMNYGTRIYCENFCNVAFRPVHRKFSDNYQPVLLINNYQHSNTLACNFSGGIYRIGSLNYTGGGTPNMYINNGACMFINNVTLQKVEVNNALLFVGSNVTIMQHNVTNGGLIVSRKNYSMDAIGKFVNRKNFAWNFTDSGPWGWRSLLNFCIDV